MREQLNELVKLAKQLRSTIQVNNVDDQTIQVSTSITVRRSGIEYYAISFMNNKKLEITLYEKGDYISNGVNIDVENLSDAELDQIILRTKEDIITFIAKLNETREIRRLDKIKELQDQLQELQGDVHTSTPSI
jgi:pyruvate kinase